MARAGRPASERRSARSEAPSRGADEDQRPLARHHQEQVDEGLVALLGEDDVGDVGDVRVALAGAGGGGDDGVPLAAVGEALHLAGEGGREEEGAAVLRGLIEDGLELVAEAQVEHLVGLVQHHHAEPGGIDGLAPQVIEEPPRRPDDDQRALAQGRELADVVGPAGHAGDVDLEGGVEPAELARDLGGQLAGGGHHQDEGTGGRGPGGARRLLGQGAGDPLEVRGDGQPDGDRLARAGLGEDAEVAPRQRRVEDGLLDGRERGELAAFEGGPDGGGRGRRTWGGRS